MSFHHDHRPIFERWERECQLISGLSERQFHHRTAMIIGRGSPYPCHLTGMCQLKRSIESETRGRTLAVEITPAQIINVAEIQKMNHLFPSTFFAYVVRPFSLGGHALIFTRFEASVHFISALNSVSVDVSRRRF